MGRRVDGALADPEGGEEDERGGKRGRGEVFRSRTRSWW